MAGSTRRRGETAATSPRSESAGATNGADTVARLAFELFLQRGAEHGHDLDDWLTAESQVRSTAAPRKRARPAAR